MNEHPIGRSAIALFAVLFAGTLKAECLSADRPSSACRYPAGDAWCARHGDGNLYAYKDGCTEGQGGAGAVAPARPPAATGSWSPMPAWDCAKARTEVERLICANPDLRAQDARMGTLYARLKTRGLAPEREQKTWLLERRGGCDDADCLRAAYAQRIRDLERLAGTQTPAPVIEMGTPAARPAPPPAAAPRTRAPEARPEPEPETQPKAEQAPTAPPPAEPASEPIPEPTPPPQSAALEAAAPRSETGIPQLPPPEGRLLHPSPGAASEAAGPGGQAGRPSGRGWGLLPAAVVASGLALGLIAWRRRRAAAAPARRRLRSRLAPIGERMGAATRAALGGLRERTQVAERRPSRAPAADSAPPPSAPPGRLDPRLPEDLPDDLVARLRALAGPGESLSAVLARAVAALETAAAEPRASAPVLSRLAALEARLAQLEETPGGQKTSL